MPVAVAVAVHLLLHLQHQRVQDVQLCCGQPVHVTHTPDVVQSSNSMTSTLWVHQGLPGQQRALAVHHAWDPSSLS